MSITISAIGNLGRDPEIVTGDNGRRRARFSLACSRKRGDTETTTWLSCTVFQDGLVGVVEQWLVKGKQVFVSGEAQLRPYTAKDGSEKLALEVVVDRLTLCGSRGDHAAGQHNGAAGDERLPSPRQVDAAIAAQAPPGRNVPRYPSGGPEFSDDIPFTPVRW